jgi:hypothetical protein
VSTNRISIVRFLSAQSITGSKALNGRKYLGLEPFSTLEISSLFSEFREEVPN